ncbi:hypothetical protein A0J48_006955 [Sphaerospermopsis aphanizomenoides BCCUSP55]|uniref:hypothetical protein n=1 Tax=Sphaerospermopsis aphanizomenoides TaxID=459663 RepID=UPI001907445B|nr:hypothetical protein [Sphaerospermopsis aphanizomenoides]MBK1987275.1 hypothetical protein [Sphaerospermopsis aphanizomenoides BCCUSP55]
MTAKKLIEILSKLPPDTEIQFDGSDEEIEDLLNQAIQAMQEAPELKTNVKQSWQLLPLKDSL